MRKKQKHKHSRRNQSIMLNLFLLLLLAVMLWIAVTVVPQLYIRYLDNKREQMIAQIQAQTVQETELVTERMTETEEARETEALTEVVTEAVQKQTNEALPIPALAEEKIYTFLQGPTAWEKKIDWSGAWSNMELADSTFGGFGCGLCCLANIYSTFSPYECTPIDMYYYSQEVTDYSPGGGYGAIAWSYLSKTLYKTGFGNVLHYGDKKYEDFRKHIAKSWCAIILVSSYYDNSYWETTGGHYVTVFDYNAEDDTIFLADSGTYTHNRQRIPLSYLYSALKLDNEYQYLTVNSYRDSNNTWKYNGTTDDWTKPAYYKQK